MALNENMSTSHDEFPPCVDILKSMAQDPLPLLAPGMIDPGSMADYGKKLLTPYRLSKEDLASQVQRYVKAFSLNMITSAHIQWTEYDPSTKRWMVKFQTSARQQQYKNAEKLKEKGAKSGIVIGSANTAFDILGVCHTAGLQTTTNVRSPTYMIPKEHLDHPASLGAYDADAQLARDLLAHLASQEPDRYKALTATGFPVLDSTNPECALMQNLIERAGGHYVDVGGTKLLEEGKAGIKANVEPVAYTATGLRFSDGSGPASQASSSSQNDKNGVDGMNGEANGKQKLGPCEIAARIDATWGVDFEGEIRGLWKRQSRLDGFWVMGGYTQQHRWQSRTLALQIKAALEGVLPPAYLDTPMSKN
ncbi:hypothetical protein PENPOL_c006G03409 [Penicillium polonicum]|uniref:Uncharacterized protein n=1 Tax=Penicillium polonicum TaxID=60169 RepID=A0A1V6NKM0_PENPO|nr:hypothetical protein PENPOL_c006G03409 [Penicillium polonicum]